MGLTCPFVPCKSQLSEESCKEMIQTGAAEVWTVLEPGAGRGVGEASASGQAACLCTPSSLFYWQSAVGTFPGAEGWSGGRCLIPQRLSPTSDTHPGRSWSPGEQQAGVARPPSEVLRYVP